MTVTSLRPPADPAPAPPRRRLPAPLTARPAVEALVRPVLEATGVVATAGAAPADLRLAAGGVAQVDAALGDVLALRRLPVAGTLRVGGRPVADLAPDVLARVRRELVVRVGPEGTLLPCLSVRDNAAAGRHATGRPVDAALVDRLLRLGGLEAVADRLPAALTPHERRVATAVRALAAGPRLVVATGVDDVLAALLAAGARDVGCAVVVAPAAEAARAVPAAVAA